MRQITGIPHSTLAHWKQMTASCGYLEREVYRHIAEFFGYEDFVAKYLSLESRECGHDRFNPIPADLFKERYETNQSLLHKIKADYPDLYASVEKCL